MPITKLAMWPVWLIEVFTTAKSYSANPIIGSRSLNRLGLHVARVRMAHLMTAWRRLFMGWMLPADIRGRYLEQGYVTIENFLPPDEFQRLRNEVLHFDGELRRMVQGDTYTYQGLLDDQTVARMPACRRLLQDQRFRRIMMYGGGVFKLPMHFAHCVVNGIASGDADPQKDFHSDTFHPTMKAWLFLDDVDDAIGPFNYVPGSHLLSRNRLAWEYENSVMGRDLANKYAQRGSLRISPDDLKARGFNEPVPLKVPANTLVMADTYGFHRRGDAAAGSSRLAIYAYSRSNPFTPLPGFAPLGWRSRIEQWITKLNLSKADAAAARRKTRPSWHLVPAHDLQDHAMPPPEVLRKSA